MRALLFGLALVVLVGCGDDGDGGGQAGALTFVDENFPCSVDELAANIYPDQEMFCERITPCAFCHLVEGDSVTLDLWDSLADDEAESCTYTLAEQRAGLTPQEANDQGRAYLLECQNLGDE